MIARTREFWRWLDPSWKFAIGVYLGARVALSAWAMLIASLFPSLTQNLNLYGTPVLVTFDLATGERYAYSRVLDGAALAFRADGPGFVTDDATASIWSLRDGRAVSGQLAGRALSTSLYTVEDVFPYRGVAASANPLLSVWQRFDTNWYLLIAQRGYAADPASAVYFPLYPATIRAVSLIVGDAMLAALIVSNLALIGVLVLFYRLAQVWFSEATGRRALVFWLLFPTAFFLFAAYTESLFLLATLGSFYFARQNRWYVAALFGVFAALTRLQGALLIVPLAWMWWQASRTTHHASRITHHVSHSASLLLIPLATLSFLAFTNLSLLSSYVGELHARFVFPWDNLWTCASLLARGQGSLVDALNLLATIGFGALLVALWKRAPREYTVYAALMWLAPLFRMTTTQPLVSMDRYVLVMFPSFALLAQWGKNSWVNRAVVYFSFPLQLYLVAQFVLWGWIG